MKEETFKLADLLKEKGVDHVLLVADGKISAHAWAINTAYRRSRELIDESTVFLRSYFDGIFRGGNKSDEKNCLCGRMASRVVDECGRSH